MRAFGRFLGRVLLVLLVAGGLLWVFGPYEQVDLKARFDPRKFGEGVQVYFEAVESRFDDITEGTEKRVIWQPSFKEQRTPYSVLYLHGFSATSEEIRPVPDRVAEALGANLVYTRLRGHGRGSAAFAEGNATAWMQDAAEGLAAARATGDKVVVIATSTGATLAAAAALDPDLDQDIAAMVLVSPNFGINDPMAWVLTLPAARYWLPLLMGEERSFEPRNAGQKKYWTTSYGWPPVLSMAALVKKVVTLDISQANVPVLFLFSDEDRVVRPDRTREVADRWSGPATIQTVTMGQGDDPYAHVIAGDIMSPGQTDAAVAAILTWLQANGVE
ncbi:alpha/beta fold hydrolase [Ruegeria sp. 2205SS24-7]|uniref:alpha/beta hydrolase n=1 Tax=Ruegeria discodermiae TaxID=3064389 RepID=UPI0027413961|nr:alpha/beta hydrolase [Ruegeria sp. 2205SS24-7]MDP5216842.1 alpha/beta fold hydrolase [Ruegeria sp. 2205SS24-7]